jgi:transposase InsO family protein
MNVVTSLLGLVIVSHLSAKGSGRFKDRVCSACQAGKQVGIHHPHKNIMTTDRPLVLLHMDLFGSIAYISIGGSKYYLVIVDDYSRFTWVFFL